MFCTEVDLTFFGPHDESAVTLCQHDTHMIFMECVVTGFSLQWLFRPFMGASVLYNRDNDVGAVIDRSPFTVTLTKKVDNGANSLYKSEIRVFSGALVEYLENNGGELKVTCVASVTAMKQISFRIEGIHYLYFSIIISSHIYILQLCIRWKSPLRMLT